MNKRKCFCCMTCFMRHCFKRRVRINAVRVFFYPVAVERTVAVSNRGLSGPLSRPGVLRDGGSVTGRGVCHGDEVCVKKSETQLVLFWKSENTIDNDMHCCRRVQLGY